MKALLYSASLIVLFASCRHQKSASTQTPPATANTPVVMQQGDVTIQTSDPSTSATIVITNPPDSEVVTTVVAADTGEVIYLISISFISRGAGIDSKTQESFEKWLNEQPKHPAYEKTHWGREGETNYCLKLNELSTREQEIFVRDVRTQLTDKELVFVTEYTKCKGRKVN